jgi:hypothetical protein
MVLRPYVLRPQFERYAERGVAADEVQPRSDMSRFHEMFPDIL